MPRSIPTWRSSQRASEIGDDHTDRPILVPRVDSPEYVATIAAICRREGVNVIFPLIDPDIPVLAAYRDELEATGARVAVVPMEAAAIAGDKWKTQAFFRFISR